MKNTKPKSATRHLLADELKWMRKASGLSQEAFAARTLPGGVRVMSLPTYVKYENGQRLPGDKVLRNIISILVRLKVVSAEQYKRESFTRRLLLIKYMAHPSDLVRTLAGERLLAEFGETK